MGESPCKLRDSDDITINKNNLRSEVKMIIRKSVVLTLTVLFVSILLTSYSSAQDTLLISYQGRLTDDGGNPVAGTLAMIFTIYDGAGVSRWTESQPAVEVVNGLFSVVLGSQAALPDSFL
jgi:hypothetical protein